MKFTLIPAGKFYMGSEEYNEEKPVHKVRINNPFYLATYPVTQREWKAVMNDSPSYFKGDDLPVEQASWDDVHKFIKKPNPWGLYDMHGNVWEWVQDMWHDSYNGAPTDGSAWERGDAATRVFRGGCWSLDEALDCRSAGRFHGDPRDRDNDFGFRLLREL